MSRMGFSSQLDTEKWSDLILVNLTNTKKNQNYAFSEVVIAFSSTLATHLIKIIGVSNRSSPKESYTRE